jgi:hypothetical protein
MLALNTNQSSNLVNNEERPEYIPCNSNYSLEHVLIDCVDVADVHDTVIVSSVRGSSVGVGKR